MLGDVGQQSLGGPDTGRAGDGGFKISSAQAAALKDNPQASQPSVATFKALRGWFMPEELPTEQRRRGLAMQSDRHSQFRETGKALVRARAGSPFRNLRQVASPFRFRKSRRHSGTVPLSTNGSPNCGSTGASLTAMPASVLSAQRVSRTAGEFARPL